MLQGVYFTVKLNHLYVYLCKLKILFHGYNIKCIGILNNLFKYILEYSISYVKIDFNYQI